MLKVCMLAYANYNNDNRVKRYAETLARKKNHVDAIVLKKDGQNNFEIIKNVNVYRIQNRTKSERMKFEYLIKIVFFTIKASFYLIKNHLKERYDIIHVHSVPDFAVFAAWLPKLMGAKVILDIHDIVPEFYASKFNKSYDSFIFKCLRLIEKISIAFSNHVIISNHIWYEKITHRSVLKEKCSVFLNYPDLSIFQGSSSKVRNKKFIMLYPGTIIWHQGLDIAIRAIALIKDELKDSEFHIYGEGPHKEYLKNLIKELSLNDIVFVKDLINLERIAPVMAAADVGIVPKRKDLFGNEAFSTKILEFMAQGVPVIVSDTNIDKFYFNSTMVKYFKSEDERDLADAILSLKNDIFFRNQLVKAGFDYIKKNNWQVKENKYLSLLEKLQA